MDVGEEAAAATAAPSPAASGDVPSASDLHVWRAPPPDALQAGLFLSPTPSQGESVACPLGNDEVISGAVSASGEVAGSGSGPVPPESRRSSRRVRQRLDSQPSGHASDPAGTPLDYTRAVRDWPELAKSAAALADASADAEVAAERYFATAAAAAAAQVSAEADEEGGVPFGDGSVPVDQVFRCDLPCSFLPRVT
jgi:hypothetical protein